MSFTTYQKVSRLAICSAAFCTLLFSAHAEPKPRFVAAQGHVVPAQGVINVAAHSVSGAQPLITSLNIREGQQVEKGQLLATTSEAAELARSLSQAQGQAKVALETQNLAQAQLLAAKSQQAVAALRVQAATQGVATAEAAVRSAQAVRIEAWNKAEAAKARITGIQTENKQILEKISGRRETAELEYEQKKLSLELEELAFNQAATNTRLAEEVEQAQAGVAAAQAELKIAEAAAQSAQADVTIAEAAATQAAAQAALAQDAAKAAAQRLALGQVRAPAQGTILQLNASEGESVPPQGLLQLGDLSQLYAEAEVYIDDLRHIKVGQQATLTGDSFAGERKGTVTRIGQVVSLPEIFSRDPASFTDKRVVKVRIRLDSDQDSQPKSTTQPAASITAHADTPANAQANEAQRSTSAPRPAAEDASGTAAPQLPVNASVLVRIAI